MRIGAHLPLADLGAGRPTGEDLCTYARTARDLGYSTLAANDHLVWSRPWLDGPTTIASVISAAGDMTLATSVALPVVRHPVVVAKTLTTLACLATGPVVGGLGPGSSSADYQAVGLPFEDRWARFDEALRLVRTRSNPVRLSSSYLFLSPWGTSMTTGKTSRSSSGGSAMSCQGCATAQVTSPAKLATHARRRNPDQRRHGASA